jgi:PKD domain
MKNKSAIQRVVACMITATSLFGCTKEEQLIKNNAPSASASSANYTGSGVTCENGLLSFADQASFDAAAAYLADGEVQTPPIYIPPSTSTTMAGSSASQAYTVMEDEAPSLYDPTVLPDSAAVAFEQQFPCYVSLRSTIENERRTLMDAGQWNETNDPDDFFIDDPVLRSLLNEKGEVKIGSSIYIIANDRTTVEIKNNDWNTLTKYRNNDPSYQSSPNYEYSVSPTSSTTAARTQNCVADFQVTRRNDGVTFDFIPVNLGSSTSQRLYWDFGDNTFSSVTSPAHFYNRPGRYVVTLRFTDSNCRPYSKTQIIETVNSFCNTPIQPDAADFTFTNAGYAATFTLAKNYSAQYSYIWDFGDGNTTLYSSSTNRAITYYHRYSDGQTYSGRLYVINGQGCVMDKGFQINIPKEQCDWPAFQRDKDYVKYDNGKRQYKYKLWATNTLFYHRVGAKTKNYEKRNNGNWKDSKASRIAAEVTGSVKPQGCSSIPVPVENYGGSVRDQRNKHSTDVEVGIGGRFYLTQGMLRSKHFVEYNGILYPNTRTLQLLKQ